MMRRFDVLLGLLLLQCVISCIGVRSSPKCPERSESDARCRRECRTDSDCRNRKKNKRCVCDGPCGLSCIRINQKCFEDRSLVVRLRKGTVLLNGESYRKKTFKVGDVVSYRCKRGFKLSGPSHVTCSGIGKWKPWDKGTPTCSRRCRDPGSPKDGYRLKESFNVGETVRFICNPGYTLKGSSVAVCRNNLEWSQPLPICEASRCEKPILPDNSHIYKGSKESYTYGSRIILRCNRGYFLVGSTLMYCGAGGWKTPNSRQLRCLPKSCGSPNSISNGVVKGTRYTFGKSVTYECNTGYRLKGSERRSCLASESWSGSPPKCEKVDCRDPESITNGKIEPYGTKYLDRASIRCDLGYIVKGSPSIFCASSGKWSEIPECIGVTCDKSYTSIENGQVVGRHVDSSCNNSYNCKLTFTCNNGFELNTGRIKKVAVCQKDGIWSSLKPNCLRISCGRPDVPDYGSLKVGTNNFLFESAVEYECNSGYDMIGRSTRECLGSGRWSESVPDCIANCGDPGYFANGHVNGSSYKSGDRLTFRCKYGYELVGESSTICDQSTATWLPRIPRCRRVYCGRPDVPDYGSLKVGTNNFLFESAVEYECNSGYDMIGKSSRECLASGRWSESVPDCIANCGDPGYFANGHVNGSSYKSGDRLTFRCKYGYELVGESSTICDQSTATWLPRIPRCRRISCKAPPSPRYGKLKQTNYAYFHDSIIEYECNDGYDLVGDSTRQCLLSKEWSGETPSCRANCQDPGTPENGLRHGNEFTGGKTVRFECNDGYTLNGANKLTCEQSTAKWTRERPTCEIGCNFALGMEDGRIADDQITMTDSVVGFTSKPRLNSKELWCGQYKSGEVAARIKFKSVVKIVGVYFDRKSRYRVNGGWFNYFDATRKSDIFVRSKNYVLFQSMKYIELKPPAFTSYFEIVMSGMSGRTVCEKFEIYGCSASATCQIPEAPRNGEVLGLLYKKEEKAVYSCFNGYKLNKNDMVQTCRADGSWTGTIPECVIDYQQLGCYKDIPTPMRPIAQLLGHPDRCIERCRRSRYKYAEMQYASECRCSNYLKVENPLLSTDCYFPCARDPTRKCGGPWIISTYKTGI